MSAGTEHRKLAAIMFTDMVGCSAMANNELLPPRVGFTKGREGVNRVLQMEESFEAVRADVGLKMFYEWDWAGADRGFDRAFTLRPNDGLAHQLYSFYLTRLGSPFDEAMDHARLSAKLEPLIPIANVAVARVLYFSGRYNEAVQEFRKVVDLFPRFVHGQNGLGLAYMKNGQPEQALEVFEQALEPGRVPVYLAGLGATLARLGRVDEARKLVAELRELYDQAAKGQERYVSPKHLAAVHAALGETPPALDWLERAVEERSPYVWMLKVDPEFESLRSEPRFLSLLRKMNLPP